MLAESRESKSYPSSSNTHGRYLQKDYQHHIHPELFVISSRLKDWRETKAGDTELVTGLPVVFVPPVSRTGLPGDNEDAM